MTITPPPKLTDEQENRWRVQMLSKFPGFDPSWPDDVRTRWFSVFNRLLWVGTETSRPTSPAPGEQE